MRVVHPTSAVHSVKTMKSQDPAIMLSCVLRFSASFPCETPLHRTRFFIGKTRPDQVCPFTEPDISLKKQDKTR